MAHLQRWLAVVGVLLLGGCSTSYPVDPYQCSDELKYCDQAKACVDLKVDPHNCGACGKACAAGQLCSAGACAATCGAGQTACDGTCRDLQADRANCGSCGKACEAGEVCAAGACAPACPASFTVCPDGSCHDTQVDPAHCGGCGTACAAGEACVAGACHPACSGGQQLCATDGGSYCASTDSDNANCGACGHACPSGQACSAGACVSSCGAQTLCSGDGGAYCANTQSDNANCGSCGHACPSGQACSGGACTTDCAGQTLCTADGGSFCANTDSDNANCGGCGHACGSGEVCSGGSCTTSCGSQTLCSGSGGAYCANTQSDNANCGSCGHACGSGEACSGGTCATSCGSQTLCTADGGSFCANTDSDNANCGGCGHACGSGEVCSGGACATDCGSQTLCTGAGGAYCASTQSDNANCGSCGHACVAGEVCVGGGCQGSCPSGQTACTGAGGAFCASTDSDSANCGACGHACAAGQRCASGACAASCGAALFACGASCVDTQHDPGNCGGCGHVCPTPAGTASYCAEGACATTCLPGLSDDDGDPANGCETLLHTSDLQLWLRADSLAGADGSPVDAWPDLSGNGRDALAPSAAARPTLKTGELNGQPVVRFNGLGQYLATAPFALFGAPDAELTVFVVLRPDAPAAAERFVLSQAQTECANSLELGYRTGDQDRANFGLSAGCGNATVSQTSIGAEFTVYAAQVLAGGAAPANVRLFRGGVEQPVEADQAGWAAPGSYGTAASPLLIGARDATGGAPDAFHQGDVAEVLVFSRALDDARRASVERYLEARYGCAGSPAVCRPVCPTAGLATYLPLDEQPAVDHTAVAARAGSGATLLTNEPATDKSVPGETGTAFRLDGVDDKVQGQGPSLGTGDFTASIWVNLLGSSTQGVLMSQGGYCFATGWLLDVNVAGPGSLRLVTGTSGSPNGTLQTAAGALSVDGQWHHLLASVARGGTSTLYLDGVPVATGTIGAGNLSSPTLAVGNATTGCVTNSYAFAQVDEVRIYQRALAPDEAARLALGCAGP